VRSPRYHHHVVRASTPRSSNNLDERVKRDGIARKVKLSRCIGGIVFRRSIMMSRGQGLKMEVNTSSCNGGSYAGSPLVDRDAFCQRLPSRNRILLHCKKEPMHPVYVS
jgi:hypothetical protein